MCVFALEEVPGNYTKFPKLTWAFSIILAATPNGNEALTLDVVGPRPPQSPILRLPPRSARSAVGMLPLAEHAGLSRRVHRHTSRGCFLTTRLSEKAVASLQLCHLCLLFGSGFPLGWHPQGCNLPSQLAMESPFSTEPYSARAQPLRPLLS